ncbi:FHA domain-containing protein [Nocardia camponoti]|uniref:FHA domain-containing protein n=1 Tax=Nocardia camponoti TaxID=1616106 RepID=A0A917V4L1_9NOCA|nr:FHA domain-containing protein [Nocardia camponoti]GGK35754.1 hypothetical protein GCM10011591_04270 [Nocardia camponoti]
MPVCTDGHLSAATDYCDVCGSSLHAVDPVVLRLCPSCQRPSPGRFCESCGHDSELPPPLSAPVVVSAPPVWFARIFADRAYYARVQSHKGPDAARVAFPDAYPERRIPLQGTEFLIGKKSVSQGIDPAIDLGIAPTDLGVSRLHAVLRIDPATGALSVTDLGSTNGTCLDGTERTIRPQVPVALTSGSRIHVGGWTTIVIEAK